MHYWEDPEHARALRTKVFALMDERGIASTPVHYELWFGYVLGQNRGHVPKHAKIYANLAAEYDRIQQIRIAAFRQFHADVQSRAFPEPTQVIQALPGEFAKFKAMLNKAGA